MVYGKAITLKTALEQKEMRNDLRKEMFTHGKKAIKDFKDEVTKKRGEEFYLDQKNTKGYVFSKELIDRFFGTDYKAEYIVVFEGCHTATDSEFTEGSPTVIIGGLKEEPKGSGNFRITRLSPAAQVATDTNEDLSEHPGRPVSITKAFPNEDDFTIRFD